MFSNIQTTDCSIRSGDSNTIETIRHIACLTWPIAYRDILSSGQISYMLSQIYDSDLLLKDLIENNHNHLVIRHKTKAVGFADISPYQHPSVPNKNSWKLHKIYVLPAVQGTGIGKKLLGASIEMVRQHGGDYFLLNVNRDNPAYHFYLKEGFQIIETGDFDIGKGFYMNDYVMGKAI